MRVTAAMIAFLVLAVAFLVRDWPVVYHLRTGTLTTRMSHEAEDAMEARIDHWLSDAEQDQQVATVSDLIDVEFDTLHVFAEAASAEQMRKIAGVSPYPRWYYGKGNVLLFMTDSDLVLWAEIGRVFSSGGTTWPSSARLVATGEPTPWLLQPMKE